MYSPIIYECISFHIPHKGGLCLGGWPWDPATQKSSLALVRNPHVQPRAQLGTSAQAYGLPNRKKQSLRACQPPHIMMHTNTTGNYHVHACYQDYSLKLEFANIKLKRQLVVLL